MGLQIITRGDPHTLDEVTRDFRPEAVYEMDATAMECVAIGLNVAFNSGRHRVVVCVAVSRVDANRKRNLAKDLGPATGDPMAVWAMGGQEDMAWFYDAALSRREKLERRRIGKVLRVQQWQERMNKQLFDMADNLEKKQSGSSSFGPLGKMQRVSS